MRGRSYTPSPPRGYGRRGRSPSPRGRYGGRGRDLPTSLLVRNLRHDCRFVFLNFAFLCCFLDRACLCCLVLNNVILNLVIAKGVSCLNLKSFLLTWNFMKFDSHLMGA